MLPAAHRLRRSSDFANTVRRGRRVARGSVVVHVTPPADTGDDEPVKAGFVVSKAVGGAVVRNKVKRRLRHLMADRVGQLPPGTTIVVRAQPTAGLTGYSSMGKDLENALEAALRPRAPRSGGRDG